MMGDHICPYILAALLFVGWRLYEAESITEVFTALALLPVAGVIIAAALTVASCGGEVTL